MAHKCDGCRYKGEHQEMMFRPMGVCNRGGNLLEAIKNYEAEKCPYKKTNADRIRAMSDEEMADWLARNQIANVAEALAIAKIPYEQEDGLKDEVAKECLDWLKQPAEEEAQQDCTYNKNGHCIGQKLMPECDAKNCDRRKA